MEQFLEKLKKKQNLSFEESKSAFELLMTGKASENEIYDFLTLLSEKGEVADEIAGGVYVLREKSKRVNVADCVDTCGTGGDGMNTLNISTASALLLASMGTKEDFIASTNPRIAKPDISILLVTPSDSINEPPTPCILMAKDFFLILFIKPAPT